MPGGTSKGVIGIVSDTNTGAKAAMLNVYVGTMCGPRQAEGISAEGIAALALKVAVGNV